ncbi:unnamed protein product, partial [Brugia timori]|uniref:C2 domain-containing protein n=1 Tax=Brugia timori TaxID=42155 RepID=A0A0R3RD24_9BILA
MSLYHTENLIPTAVFQYRFDIDVDNSEVRFALTQKVKDEGEKNREPLVTIGMHLMRVENNRIYRIHQAINPEVTSDYNYGRSVYLHCQNLQQGRGTSTNSPVITAIRTYVVINCDKEEVRTRTVEGTKVFWNQCFIFYGFAFEHCWYINLNWEHTPMTLSPLLFVNDQRDMTHNFLIALMEER